jgi:GxxExxY protein
VPDTVRDEGPLIVEVEAVRQLEKVHAAQVLTYMKHFGSPLGLPINFNVSLLKDGIRPVALGVAAMDP